MTPDEKPYELIALDPDEFIAAHEYAAMVAENEFLEEIPGLKSKIRIEDKVLSLTNIPMNRFGLAIMRFFRGRKHDKGWSFMMRMFAMGRVMRAMKDNKEMKPFTKEVDGREEFHAAIFEVAATQKLNAKHEFSPALFLKSVKRVAKRMDADESSAS